MNAIELLMDEHRLILRVLDALDGFAEKVARGSEDKVELGRFTTFVRQFADARHHGKEEDILFAAMIEAGFPREGGPIAVMLMEHGAGRSHIARLAALAQQAAPWTDEDRQALVREASGYTRLLRSHIQKEDDVLYPMARRHLGTEAMSRIDDACAAYERRLAEASGPDLLRSLGGELAARHGTHRAG